MPPPKKKKGAGNGGVVPPVKHRFSKDNQPSREAKSKGKYDWWAREHLRERFNEVFSEEIELASGGKIIGYRALAKRLLKYFLGDGASDKQLTDKQVSNALKLIEVISPSENKINFTGNLKTQGESSLKIENADTVAAALKEVFNECFDTSQKSNK